ncbi:MAG TPA: hypothetical protein VNM14_25225 [Planctomycetota bacterium]|nr:hypothetical protein [Planctomycetota bacterium]
MEEAIRLRGTLGESYALRADVRVDQGRVMEKDNDKAGAETLDKAERSRVVRSLEETRQRLLDLRP